MFCQVWKRIDDNPIIQLEGGNTINYFASSCCLDCPIAKSEEPSNSIGQVIKSSRLFFFYPADP